MNGEGEYSMNTVCMRQGWLRAKQGSTLFDSLDTPIEFPTSLRGFQIGSSHAKT